MFISKITHLLSREPRYNYIGDFVIKDELNEMSARVELGKARRSSDGQRPNALRVFIEGRGVDGANACVEGEGLWTRYVRFGNLLYWRVSDEPEKVIEFSREDSLPSSAQHRNEIQLIRERRLTEADRQLQKVEDEEKRDALLRKKKKV